MSETSSKTIIIYGSLTGNTQFVAETISSELIEAGIEATTQNVLESTPANLETADNLIIGASTWDDGLVQYDFADFLNDLKNTKPNLAGKKLAVFGCGDTNYEHFCIAVDIIEKQVSELGAEVITNNLKINGFPQNGENMALIEEWTSQLLAKIK